MDIQEWVFLVLSVSWLLEFMLFRGSRTKTNAQSKEQRSYYLILGTIILCVIVSLLIRELSEITTTHLFFIWFSLILYFIGIFLRYWSMLTLKQEFTRHVQVSADKKLVGHGPYRYMRHPLYTALFICMIGLSSYLASWVGLVTTILLVLPTLLFRIKLEEAMLTEALGGTYDQWKQQRWILLPWIY
ncbi:methyltransferase family protein [Alkalicoccobacillus murimartini]|uniref:Protein-S-isoprenylcysteine O-methyltransferase Ste14 n=1 Tax=Alkalicoccobacillus murimartini TaxID=171685 RepID=A0ABT9YE06_9BACI|nr:isoprenylcysteine carboxylmethyltransferase family protein [Alkalicoccobacillus murimartini]MDQ0206072.1 protein-S-isoprenylcysteine O-methyltransferase Ste14 [Alkalicoccobacillus murimartini]